MTWKPAVEWVVEQRGVTLLRPEEGVLCSIPYPFAVVWDGIVRGFDETHMIQLFSRVARVDEEEGGRLLTLCLEQWREARLIAEGRCGA